jgi:group II intron reverse transcriptase/maturase
MTGALEPETISTKRARIAEQARNARDMVFVSLNQYLDMDILHEAHRQTRKDAAAGVDGQTAAEYAKDLEGNLRDLLERAKSGRYVAPAVRRVHIPKGTSGKTRPIGIPTFEDKILQRAVVMILEPIYEQDFLDCSYGFRPRRSAHQALQALRNGMMSMWGGCWVLEVDIASFFDTLDPAQLRGFLDSRVRDGVLRRLIHKWLKAGVLEEGQLKRPTGGTPQGGVISPLLANIYLHEVLDLWYERDVKPRLQGETAMVRFADDFVIIFRREDDARRVMEVLPKRFARYGLTLHPDKTRLLRFEPPQEGPKNDHRGNSFNFLGFTHVWGKSRKGNWVVRQLTAKDRLRRSLTTLSAWIRRTRHLTKAEQHKALCQRVRGHYGYYGITGNIRALQTFLRSVVRSWKKWLDRRSQKSRRSWDRFKAFLQHYPLPAPRIIHSYVT